MVREAKFCWDNEDCRIESPFGRESLFDDEQRAVPARIRGRRRRKRLLLLQPHEAPQGPATRRDLAGADWMRAVRARQEH